MIVIPRPLALRFRGVLRRCLLVYQECVIKLRNDAAAVPADALQKTAALFRTFGEQYHEKKLEEFRRRNAGQLPTQVTSNLQMMQTTQLQIQANADGAGKDRDRLRVLESDHVEGGGPRALPAGGVDDLAGGHERHAVLPLTGSQRNATIHIESQSDNARPRVTR